MVVGVDGSTNALAALRWAGAEARLRQAPLRIVHAWTYGYMGMAAGGYGYLGGLGAYSEPGIDPTDLQRAAEELLDGLIRAEAVAVEGLEIERRVVDGSAATALIGAAAPEDLLVVGSRGHGGFTGLLLGSVSQQCVHHARCPVVVVHPPTDGADQRRVGPAVTDGPQ